MALRLPCLLARLFGQPFPEELVVSLVSRSNRVTCVPSTRFRRLLDSYRPHGCGRAAV